MPSFTFVLMAALSATHAEPNEPLQLHLVCTGDGVQRRVEVSTGSVTGPDGSYTGAVTYGRDDPFSEEVLIEIADDGGRIRLPRAMLPLIRGGRDGWMELRKVKVTPHEISASASINFLNKARIHINRVTGTISMSVLRGRFDGRCEAFDPATVQRAF